MYYTSNSVPAVADMPTHSGNPHVHAGAIATVSDSPVGLLMKNLNFYSCVAG
jgi:hypothetical protein